MRLGVRFAALSRSTRQTSMLAMKLHARFVQGGQQLQSLIGQMLGNRILGHKPVRMNQRNMAPVRPLQVIDTGSRLQLELPVQAQQVDVPAHAR